MSSLTVSLGENSYDVLIESGSLTSLGHKCTALSLCGQVAVITNPTVFALYGQIVVQSLENVGNQVTVITIQDGEEYKNTDTLNQVYDRLVEAGLDRTSFIVALGGGVRNISARGSICTGSYDAVGSSRQQRRWQDSN